MQNLIPLLKSQGYKADVERHLTKREDRRNPAPHYIGLISTAHNRESGLSSKGLVAMSSLIDIVGHNHVHVIALRARQISNIDTRIEFAPISLK
jgi:hypothetical protein